MPRLLPLVLLLLPLCGCKQMLEAVNPKAIDPAVIAGAQRENAWYRYVPENAPGFCLVTQRAIIWHDPEMHLGCWLGRNPVPPHRVLMEARDSTFVLHRRYVWDGMSWGNTVPRDLRPTLLHDALYHALQGGAPFPRSEADRAFLRARRAEHVGTAYCEYLAIRSFGGLFNNTHGRVSLLVERLSPQTPLLPLEPDHPEIFRGGAYKLNLADKP